MTFPQAPWRLHGTMWLSLLLLPRAGEGVDGPRPAGLWGAAWVEYVEPSPLTYRELLVARPVGRSRGARAGVGPRVRVTDIWVDSPASRDGGRALWAIPKGLADLGSPDGGSGWSATLDGRPVAQARLAAGPGAGPRLPLRLLTDQPALPEGGPDRVAPVRGSARLRPLRARWRFAEDGPLAWLGAARPLGSVRLDEFSLTFG